MNVKVSIIVPVYQAASTLQICVGSLTGQTLGEIQIILVDDGSDDGSGALCDGLAAADKRICVIHKKNEGAGLARNAGLEAAVGLYVGFVDADDRVLPDMYETLYTEAWKLQADMAIAGARFMGGSLFAGDGEELRNCFSKLQVFEGEGIKDLLLGTVGALPEEPEDTRYGFSVWKGIYRRKLLEQNNISFVSERIFASEDLLFQIDVISSCKRAIGVPGAFYCYLRNENSFSKAYRQDRYLRSKDLYLEVERRLSRVMSREAFKLYTARHLLACARIAVVQEIDHARETDATTEKLKQRLWEICHDPLLTGILKEYPWHRLPRRQAAFAFSMRFQMIWLSRLLVYLRGKR